MTKGCQAYSMDTAFYGNKIIMHIFRQCFVHFGSFYQVVYEKSIKTVAQEQNTDAVAIWQVASGFSSGKNKKVADLFWESL